MKQSLASLQAILEKQNYLLLELLNLGEEELEALKTDNLTSLQAITTKQQSLSETLAKLEQERLVLQAYLAKENQLSEGFTLKDLVKLDLPGSQEIELIGKTLADNFLKLKDLNETNNLLIRQSLGLINKVLGALAPKQGTTYGQTGRMSPDSPSLKIDKSV